MKAPKISNYWMDRKTVFWYPVSFWIFEEKTDWTNIELWRSLQIIGISAILLTDSCQLKRQLTIFQYPAGWILKKQIKLHDAIFYLISLVLLTVLKMNTSFDTIGIVIQALCNLLFHQLYVICMFHLWSQNEFQTV